jgi:hypothetical protein
MIKRYNDILLINMNSIGPEPDKPILRMMLAGVASIAAGGSTHPVDTVKVRL